MLDNSLLTNKTSVQTDDDLLTTLTQTTANLQYIQKFLNDIATAVNSYNSKILAEDTIYQNYRTGIITARTEVDGALNSITSAQTTLKSAAAQVDNAVGAQKIAQDQLSLVIAPARQTDAAAYLAAIDQAQAAVEQIRAQINDLTITAPAAGIIAATNGNVGEIISAATPIAVLIPIGSLQIKLNVSEDNIVDVKTGQSVDIALEALSNSQLFGKIIAIDPAETIISGAVYYQTTVNFDQIDERIRPGMTVNALIKTTTHQNALLIPAAAIYSNKNKFVKLLQNNKVIEQEIQTGIEGEDGMVEIISGLQEGQQVILSNN